MLNHLPLNEIINGCKQDKPGYWAELCRRAFDEKNEEALKAIYNLLSDISLSEIIDGCKKEKPEYYAELCRRAFNEKNEEALKAIDELLNDPSLNRIDELLRHFPLNEIIDGYKKNKPKYDAELCRRAFDEKNEEALRAVYDLLSDLSLSEIIDGCKKNKPEYYAELCRRAFDEKDKEALKAIDELLNDPSFNGIDDLLRHFPLNEIIHGCRQRKPEYCFELFRRAFDENNEEAKTAIYKQYKGLVFGWAHRALVNNPFTEQDVEDIASQAWSKFIKHLKRVSIADCYNHVAQLLAYLRRCVKTTTLDFFDDQERKKKIEDELTKNNLTKPKTQNGGTEGQHLAAQIREIVEKHVKDPEEWLYIRLRFVYDMKPSQMVDDGHFRDRKTVYKIWDRLKKRLKPVFSIYLK